MPNILIKEMAQPPSFSLGEWKLLLQLCKQICVFSATIKVRQVCFTQENALNTLIPGNVDAPTAWLSKSNLILAMFPYSDLFGANFLH